MKRIGNLWPAVIERGNLLRAFHQAARGKRQKMEVRRFAENLDENLDQLRQELEQRSFETGKFNVFIGFRLARSSDPMRRMACQHEHGTEPVAVPLASDFRVRQNDNPPARRW